MEREWGGGGRDAGAAGRGAGWRDVAVKRNACGNTAEVPTVSRPRLACRAHGLPAAAARRRGYWDHARGVRGAWDVAWAGMAHHRARRGVARARTDRRGGSGRKSVGVRARGGTAMQHHEAARWFRGELRDQGGASSAMQRACGGRVACMAFAVMMAD